MSYVVKQSKLNGVIDIPPSKSYSHRHLILGMLSKKKVDIFGLNECDDIEATINVARNLGCEVSVDDCKMSIDSTRLFTENKGVMDVNASASTLRFLIPVCLTKKGTYRFYLRHQLVSRSLKVYEELFKHCMFKRDGQILEIEGHIEPGVYEVDGSHSSQFLSGLFFALPLLNGDSEVIIKPPLVSLDYFKMTLACIEQSGIKIEKINECHYKIYGNQTYQYEPFMVESDASAAAYIKVAQYLGHDVSCEMSSTHFQKDAIIDELLIQLSQGDCIINVKDCPDLTPPLALAMALTPGHFEIAGASRLKDKESNRLVAISDVLKTLGAKIEMNDDGFVIDGQNHLNGGEVDSYLDHRIAMMAVIAAFHCTNFVMLHRADCVSKSWPTFYKQIKKAGGVLYEL